MSTELKLFFVQNDLANFVDERFGESPFYADGISRFNRHYIKKLACYVEDEYKFTTTMYEAYWAGMIREHFPEFEDIMGFAI